MTKTKTFLVAALVLGSASAAVADTMPFSAEEYAYLRNPNAPVPTYAQPAPAAQAGGQLIEGRNVGVGSPANIFETPSELRIQFDRNSADFRS